nr:unnamed protein product [Digitaria exilis]
MTAEVQVVDGCRGDTRRGGWPAAPSSRVVRSQGRLCVRSAQGATTALSHGGSAPASDLEHLVLTELPLGSMAVGSPHAGTRKGMRRKGRSDS